MGPKTVADAEGVSSVVGTVLMLGVTMAIFAGFSFVVLEAYSEDQARLRADLGLLHEEGRYLLQHRGGDALDLPDGRLLMTVDGAEVELPLAALSAQTSDGATWRIGEALCLAGPQPPCHYADAAITRILLVYDGVAVLSDAPAFEPGPVETYVATATPAVGTVAALDAAQADDASGLEATLAEGAVAVPAGSGGPAKFSGATATGSGALLPDDALTSDDQRSTLGGNNDYVEVSGLDLPPSAATVTALVIGFEGQSATGGSPTARLDYRIGSGPESAGSDQSIAASADADYTSTPAGTFTVADVESLVVQVQRTGNRDILVDHVYATVTYTTAAGTVYTLDVRMDFTAVPAGLHDLELEYRAGGGESFRVHVWDGTAYNARGGILGAAAATAWSYTLSTAEYNGGAPRIRFVDAGASDLAQGSLALDYVRVVTT